MSETIEIQQLSPFDYLVNITNEGIRFGSRIRSMGRPSDQAIIENFKSNKGAYWIEVEARVTPEVIAVEPVVEIPKSGENVLTETSV